MCPLDLIGKIHIYIMYIYVMYISSCFHNLSSLNVYFKASIFILIKVHLKLGKLELKIN